MVVAVLIWVLVVLAARGLLMGEDDPIAAVRYQGEQLLSQWFSASSVAPGGELHVGPDGLTRDTYSGCWVETDGTG
jgi:hypothetical protein